MNQSVVQLDEISTEIIQVRMQDIENKNTFTSELMEALNQAFAYIEQNQQYKVVVLTGYGHYFASGGTKQGLLDIYEKRVKFTDTNIYRLPLDCSLPVISAMQGHGIGGGLFLDYLPILLSWASIVFMLQTLSAMALLQVWERHSSHQKNLAAC